MRLEVALRLDRIGLGGHVALHGGVLVGEERLRVEGVGLHFRFVEAVIGLQPLEIAGDALLGHEQREPLEVLELLRRPDARSAPAGPSGTSPRPRSSECSCSTASNDCSVLALMKKSSLPTGSRMRLFTFGPPGTMVDVEAVFLVSAVGQRLIEAAVLGLRHPIGAEADLVERLRLHRGKACGKPHYNRGRSHHPRTLSLPPPFRQAARRPLNLFRRPHDPPLRGNDGRLSSTAAIGASPPSTPRADR